MQRAQHGLAQDAVDARLVALALALEPCQHIGAQPYRGAGLGGPVELALHRLFPKGRIKGRDVAGVDGVTWHAGQRLEFSLLLGRQRR